MILSWFNFISNFKIIFYELDPSRLLPSPLMLFPVYKDALKISKLFANRKPKSDFVFQPHIYLFRQLLAQYSTEVWE